jgi:ribosomal protein S18 acetylase RimI-like enzyme
MKLGKKQLGACSCTLRPLEAMPEIIELSDLHTKKDHRGKGIANRLMDEICEEADKSKKVLVLMPDGDEWLHTWYETHGFKTIQAEPVVLMARQPYV